VRRQVVKPTRQLTPLCAVYNFAQEFALDVKPLSARHNVLTPVLRRTAENYTKLDSIFQIHPGSLEKGGRAAGGTGGKEEQREQSQVGCFRFPLDFFS
jgi:hypothetical protein